MTIINQVVRQTLVNFPRVARGVQVKPERRNPEMTWIALLGRVIVGNCLGAGETLPLESRWLRSHLVRFTLANVIDGFVAFAEIFLICSFLCIIASVILGCSINTFCYIKYTFIFAIKLIHVTTQYINVVLIVHCILLFLNNKHWLLLFSLSNSLFNVWLNIFLRQYG